MSWQKNEKAVQMLRRKKYEKKVCTKCQNKYKRRNELKGEINNKNTFILYIYKNIYIRITIKYIYNKK